MTENIRQESPLRSHLGTEKHMGDEKNVINPPPSRPCDVKKDKIYPTAEKFEIITRANINNVVRGDHLAYVSTILGE